MTDYKAKLDRLDTGRLIDVVKNYRQYGYDDNLRATAITILNKRGITKNDLKITGNFENKTYDHAHDLFKSFGKNSTIAFVLYAILLLTNIMIEILFSYFEPAILLVMLLNWAFLIGYLTFLVISFLNQYQFYKVINLDYGTEGALLYLFVGMPFYIFMYFYFKNQMKEKMKHIK